MPFYKISIFGQNTSKILFGSANMSKFKSDASRLLNSAIDQAYEAGLRLEVRQVSAIFIDLLKAEGYEEVKFPSITFVSLKEPNIRIQINENNVEQLHPGDDQYQKIRKYITRERGRIAIEVSESPQNPLIAEEVSESPQNPSNKNNFDHDLTEAINLYYTKFPTAGSIFNGIDSSFARTMEPNDINSADTTTSDDEEQ